MDTSQLVKESEYTYLIPEDERMHCPGRLFLSEQLLELIGDGSIDQVRNAATLPGAVGYSLGMPDMHVGYGFCVGGVSAYRTEDGIISPGAIGFDINCGVRVLATDVDAERAEELIEPLLSTIAERVPAGVGRQSSISLTDEELDEVLVKGARWALENGYAQEEDVVRTEEGGRFAGADPNRVSHQAKARGRGQLGTLGGGNHFLEVQVVDEIFDEEVAGRFGISHEGQVVVMIHTGSRGFGHQVCTDYLRKIEKQFPDVMDALPEKNLAYAPLESKVGKDYFGAMQAAANFAFCNRQVIAHRVRNAFERLFPGSQVRQVYDIAHNIAKKEVHVVDGEQVEVLVHRKGATRAFPPGREEICAPYRDVGQPVLIPGSMGTSSYILTGTQKAMEQAFG